VRTKRVLALIIALALVVAFAAGCGGQAEDQAKEPQQQAAEPKVKDVILATTTSTVDTGLLDVLVPEFEKQTGYKVKTISVGTGQALEMGKKGEADVLLVHAPASEKELVDSGVGIDYSLVMHNDFIIVGPENDPAGIKNAATSAEAFAQIASKAAIFVSRGDESGTHKKEMSIWKEAGIDPSGSWYHSTGAGMGQTLQVASEKQGYTLTDRGTYLAQRDNLKLAVLKEGDKSLLNIYHVMAVNPEKFDKVNYEGAKAFIDFMVGDNR